MAKSGNQNRTTVQPGSEATLSASPSKSLESWIWDTARTIRGARDAPKYKDYILPLIFTKRLCDVFDDELNRIAAEVGSRKKASHLAMQPMVPNSSFSIIRS